jgi:hypothetical protein
MGPRLGRAGQRGGDEEGSRGIDVLERRRSKIDAE